jgi:DNA replication protein DnaC
VIATGVCQCGREVEREQLEGRFAALAQQLPFYCPECSAALEEQWAAEDAEEQRRHDRERFERKTQCLPPALRKHRLSELDIEGRANAMVAANRWSKGELRGLGLIGDVGLGKTTIAAAAVRDYIARNLDRPTPRWIGTTQALTHLARSFGASERERVLEALTSRDLPLALDDLDKSRPSASAAEVIFQAIDSCITHERPLLVTTNLMPAQLATNWPSPHGEAIASRLVGYCELHRISGRDRRLKGPASPAHT